MNSKINILIRLFETIEKRANEDSTTSYTSQLLSEGKEKCIAKVREEALETVEAAEQNGSFQAQIDAERQAAGVTSAADIARQRYAALQAKQDQGLVRDIWFGNPHND